MKQIYNKITGEIKTKSVEDIPSGQYDDAEYFEPGTSLTSLEGYEPLESIIARCTRVMVDPSGNKFQVIDLDQLKAEQKQSGVYECAGAKDIDEAFDRTDPTDIPGFDLADASALSETLKVKTAQASVATEEQAPATPKEAEASDGVATAKQDFPEKVAE